MGVSTAHLPINSNTDSGTRARPTCSEHEQPRLVQQLSALVEEPLRSEAARLAPVRRVVVDVVDVGQDQTVSRDHVVCEQIRITGHLDMIHSGGGGSRRFCFICAVFERIQYSRRAA